MVTEPAAVGLQSLPAPDIQATAMLWPEPSYENREKAGPKEPAFCCFCICFALTSGPVYRSGFCRALSTA